VSNKNWGSLIKTIMTRCIHCTRCTRFGAEIAGLEVLGTLNRGSSMEIGTYLPKLFSSEISGNAIDLRPVAKIGGKNRFIRRVRMKMSRFQKELNLEKKKLEQEQDYLLDYEEQLRRERDPIERQKQYQLEYERQK